MTGVLLAIEASQRTGGVAVRDAGGAAHEEMLAGHVRHDDDLVAAIDRLYRRVGLSPRQTKGIAVSVGPGGFTGLRVSVSTGKLLAESLGAPLVAVPTALVVAESHDGPGPIIVALASKGEMTWVTRVQQCGAAWAIDGDGHLVGADRLRLEGVSALLADRYLPQAIADECARAGVPVVEPVFTPLACLVVASRLFEKSRTTDPLHLAPIYARPPSAVSLWERRHEA